MPTKANGPLMADYNRLLKVAKKVGWKVVRVKFPDGTEITLKEEVEEASKPPNGEMPKKEPHNWKQW